MVQNPPAIPTLPIVQLVRLMIGSKLVIDWHNTAYSILALKFGTERHPMVRLAKWYIFSLFL
ncbi:mannosyltransferase [Puccinia graminis f. sp. tritici]|uniref:Chitobiosyldiphosphodolichol beta-mannosyltransferase n=1 Tax=Puccinia graminis f. sp. tritici TaxID=56615 RepID=A0A5B0Q3F8_PUCGR|nr:mannosyltransferase [Puccinia graminis f. sp. tritici]